MTQHKVAFITGVARGQGRAHAVKLASCFAVLHHAESAAVQVRVFAELLRVLRPGGILVGSEGYDNERTRLAHAGDQFVPVDPDALPWRLEAIGFTGVEVEHGELDFRFQARKPA